MTVPDSLEVSEPSERNDPECITTSKTTSLHGYGFLHYSHLRKQKLLTISGIVVLTQYFINTTINICQWTGLWPAGGSSVCRFHRMNTKDQQLSLSEVECIYTIKSVNGIILQMQSVWLVLNIS